MRLGTWPGKRFRDRAAPQGFPPKKKIQPGATATLRLAVDLTLAGRFCSRFSGDREKPGAKEGGGADLALLCPPGPVSRWIPPWAPKQKQSSLAPGFSWSPECSSGRKDFLPVEPPPQADLSFLFLLGAPRFA